MLFMYHCLVCTSHALPPGSMSRYFVYLEVVWIVALLQSHISPVTCLTLLDQAVSTALPRVGQVTAGPLKISELGCGTWSWGNRLLWDYDPSQDEEIYEAYAMVRRAGVTVFDTADSYGTLDLNGRAEILLGEFERRYQSELSSQSTPWWDLGAASVANRPQQVATKFAPYPWRITRQSILAAAKASLRRLDQPKLAIAQAHWSTANYQRFQEGAIWEGLADVYDGKWRRFMCFLLRPAYTHCCTHFQRGFVRLLE